MNIHPKIADLPEYSELLKLISEFKAYTLSILNHGSYNPTYFSERIRRAKDKLDSKRIIYLRKFFESHPFILRVSFFSYGSGAERFTSNVNLYWVTGKEVEAKRFLTSRILPFALNTIESGNFYELAALGLLKHEHYYYDSFRKNLPNLLRDYTDPIWDYLIKPENWSYDPVLLKKFFPELVDLIDFSTPVQGFFDNSTFEITLSGSNVSVKNRPDCTVMVD